MTKLYKRLCILVILTMLVEFAGFAELKAVQATSLPDSLPDQITLSWTEDPEVTQTIAWRTGSDSDQNGVQYLPEAGFNGSFTGAQEVTAVKTDLYDGYAHFEATLRGLTPGIKYIYRVGKEGAWSEPASFATAAPTNRFSFLYMGDIQRDYENWGDELKSAVAENPSLKFALQGGDLVNDGNSGNEWQQLFEAADPVFRQIPLMPTAGNHDDVPLFWNSFALPQNGPEGYKEKFYSFDYGNSHIAVLDSNIMGRIPADGSAYEEITSWLRNDLKNSRQRWKFLVFHHPPYTAVFDGLEASLQLNWVPIFEECNVDAAFVGHQHVYLRTYPIRGGEVQKDGEGIVYIMGNAGTKNYDAGENYNYIAKEAANKSNYEVIDIDGDTFTLTARTADGQVIDSYTLTKQPLDDHAAYTVTPMTDANYQAGATEDGISIMTENTGVSGMKYFGVQVAPVKAHDGYEAVVFTHERNGVQLSRNITKADFDAVDTARAGFNVKPGDVVEACVVDDLTNAVDFNPTILQ